MRSFFRFLSWGISGWVGIWVVAFFISRTRTRVRAHTQATPASHAGGTPPLNARDCSGGGVLVSTALLRRRKGGCTGFASYRVVLLACTPPVRVHSAFPRSAPIHVLADSGTTARALETAARIADPGRSINRNPANWAKVHGIRSQK